MNGRKSKVKSWMQNIHKDINDIQDIFNFNLITAEDIGEHNYNNIINKLDDTIILIEDVLFELDSR